MQFVINNYKNHMKAFFLNTSGLIIVQDIANAVIQNKDYLCDLDGIIGDGDHGVNMNKGFLMSLNQLESNKFNFSDSLEIVGETLMDEIGGSMGPLYGTFFKTMAKVSKNEVIITSDIFQKMIFEATKKVMEMGNAKPGDKSLIDTLSSALNYINDAIVNKKPFDIVLNECSIGAQKGKESTRNMLSKIGRSSRLGERTIGHIDAGAASCSIIIETMCSSILKLLKD